MTLEQLRKDPTAEYIGDGVYACHDSYQVWVHVTDGIRVYGSIALEPATYQALKNYADRIYGVSP